MQAIATTCTSEAKCDHERHPAPRAGGCRQRGRRSQEPRNHAQTVRNLERSPWNATTGARLIQVDGLDSKSATEVADSIADALEELPRLKRSLDRRIRRDQGR